MKGSGSIDHERRVFSYQSWLVSALLVTLGLSITIILGYLSHHSLIAEDGVAALLLGHLATAFLIAGLWHAIETFLTRSEFIDLVSIAVNTHVRRVESKLQPVIDQAKSSRHDRRLGFERSYTESHPELYEDIIANSDELTVVVNNGYVWVHTHRDNLKTRFCDPTKKTMFILLNPDSLAATLMEAKENMSQGAYRSRTDEALKLIADATNDHSNVAVFGVSIALGQAVFLTESRALVVPRFYLEPSIPPVFSFENVKQKKSYYRRLHDDIQHVLKHEDTIPMPLRRAPTAICQAEVANGEEDPA